MSQVIDVYDADFESVVFESKTPVLVDFWGSWCAPCKMIAPFIDFLSEEFSGELIVAKCNLEENQEVPAQLRIRSVPYIMIVKDGDIVHEHAGAPDPDKLIEVIREIVSSKP